MNDRRRTYFSSGGSGVYIASSNKGILRSTDGINWSVLHIPKSSSEVKRIRKIIGNTIYYIYKDGYYLYEYALETNGESKISGEAKKLERDHPGMEEFSETMKGSVSAYVTGEDFKNQHGFVFNDPRNELSEYHVAINTENYQKYADDYGVSVENSYQSTCSMYIWRKYKNSTSSSNSHVYYDSHLGTEACLIDVTEYAYKKIPVTSGIQVGFNIYLLANTKSIISYNNGLEPVLNSSKLRIGYQYLLSTALGGDGNASVDQVAAGSSSSNTLVILNEGYQARYQSNTIRIEKLEGTFNEDYSVEDIIISIKNTDSSFSNYNDRWFLVTTADEGNFTGRYLNFTTGRGFKFNAEGSVELITTNLNSLPLSSLSSDLAGYVTVKSVSKPEGLYTRLGACNTPGFLYTSYNGDYTWLDESDGEVTYYNTEIYGPYNNGNGTPPNTYVSLDGGATWTDTGYVINDICEMTFS